LVSPKVEWFFRIRNPKDLDCSFNLNFSYRTGNLFTWFGFITSAIIKQKIAKKVLRQVQEHEHGRGV
jgi:hypothetical protein